MPRELCLTSIGVFLEEMKPPLSMNSDKANFQVGVLLEELYSRDMRRRAQAQAGGIIKPIIVPSNKGGRPQEARAVMEKVHQTLCSTQAIMRRKRVQTFLDLMGLGGWTIRQYLS